MIPVHKISVLFVITAALLFAFSTITIAANSIEQNRVIAFLHVTVIPMDRERELNDQTVVITDRKITAIGPSSKVKVPEGAFRVDATDRFLIPALCDMHVHLLGEAWNLMLPADKQLHGKDVPSERFLFPYIANGVTTVQDLFGTSDEISLRQRIVSGEIIGPRLILAKAIDGAGRSWPPPLTTWVANADEAAKAVRDAKASGYDKIKVYSFLDKASYDAIIRTAKELNLDVIGHIPMSISPEYAIESGQKMFAHSEELAKHAKGDYSTDRINYFADLMAKNGVWMTPTLVTSHTFIELFANPDSVLHRSEAVYYRHPMQQGTWNFMTEKLYLPVPAAGREKIRLDFEKFQQPLTKAFFDRGGRMIAGSDTILPGLVPGFALHRELKELVDIGLTPYQALRTSTTAPFEYLGEIDKAGTIEVGKLSDLVLVDADPLKDISNAAKIYGVLIRGRWIGDDELKSRMKDIATR